MALEALCRLLLDKVVHHTRESTRSGVVSHDMQPVGQLFLKCVQDIAVFSLGPGLCVKGIARSPATERWAFCLE